ncbi:hypothetical protein E2I00_015181, partial [Balaenoptera physalus]
AKLKLTSVENSTEATEFILLGLTDDPNLQVPLLLVFLFIYLITLVGNWGGDSHLHTPMYFFLSDLSFVDPGYSSAVAPKTVAALHSGNKLISHDRCAAQSFFFVGFATVECYLLASMACDRHAMLCRPLHYTTTMTAVPPLLALSCSNTRMSKLVVFFVVGFNVFFTLLVILISYFFIYIAPSSTHSVDMDKIASVFYMVVIPMLNPLIYSLRNKEVKHALRKILNKLNSQSLS